MRRKIITAWITALLLPLPCIAQDRCDHVASERLDQEGEQLRDRHENAAAIERFRQAQALCANPGTLARQGGAEGALGRYIDAERSLQRALEMGAHDPWIASHREALEAALRAAREHLATIELHGDGPVAVVTVEDGERGQWPAERSFRVIAGDVRVVVRAQGCDEWSRTLHVEATGTARETVALVCRPVAPPPPPPPPLAHQPSGRGLAWGLIVGGGVSLLGGAVAAGFYGDALPVWNDDRQCIPPNGLTRYTNCWPQGDRIEYTLPTMITGLALGAAALTWGIILLVWPRSTSVRRASPTRVSFGCGAGPGALGMACGGVF
jgi:hypothetical protein